MTYEVAELGHPVLSQQAAPVDDFGSEAFDKLVAAMLSTMEERGGVGIAAPQLAVSKQIMIVASQPNQRYPDAPRMQPMILVNPDIVWQSRETEKAWEGCLSVPAIRGQVERSAKVDVSYFDRQGISKKVTFEGFPARIFLHEYDHLIGLTFLDRVVSAGDLASEVELARRL